MESNIKPIFKCAAKTRDWNQETELVLLYRFMDEMFEDYTDLEKNEMAVRFISDVVEEEDENSAVS